MDDPITRPWTLTCLVADTPHPARADLRPEHGLALHLTDGNRSLLLDAGATPRFFDNAGALGVDLSTLDAVILSHHHYDHGGGLPELLDRHAEVPVHLRPWDETVRHTSLRDYEPSRFVGLPAEGLRRHLPRLRFIEEDTQLWPGVWLLVDIPVAHPSPLGNGRLCVADALGERPDPFEHELLLVLERDGGLILVTGCGHRGALNLVEAARVRFPGRPIRSLAGGLHLLASVQGNRRAATAEQEAVAKGLLSAGVERVVTGHCTSDDALATLRRRMGARVQPLHTGAKLEL